MLYHGRSGSCILGRETGNDQKRPKEAILASPLLERDTLQSGTSTETALGLVAVTSKVKVTSVVNLDRPML